MKRWGERLLQGLVWLVLCAGAAYVVVQLYEATRILAALLVPINPNDEIASRHLIVALPRFFLILYGLGWLVVAIYMLYAWTEPDRQRPVWLPFGRIAAIEILLAAVTLAIINWLPLAMVSTV